MDNWLLVRDDFADAGATMVQASRGDALQDDLTGRRLLHMNFKGSARLLTLLRRSAKAARFGFIFLGTTRTSLPKSVTVLGKRSALVAPDDGGYVNDVINIWLDDEYGLNTFSCAPKTIVDIGANIGLFSLWAAHCFPNAIIHAYEPNPRIFPFTKANLNPAGIKVFQEGVGSQEGRAKLLDERESRMASTTTASDGDVKITSIANVIKRIGGSADLIKIDCEGAEWDILKDRSSFQNVASIRMEYHLVSGASVTDFTECVRRMDFAVDELIPNQGFGIAWLRRKNAHET